jgi:hypothetical protein
MREIFSRKQENGTVSYEVELEAQEHKEDNPWLFSVFVKFDLVKQSAEAYEEFLETKESLIIAVEYDQKAYYLGSRMIDGWVEFYFCANDCKDLTATVSTILKNSHYVYESNSVKDKKWNFFETQLFPTELELIDIQSEHIIFLLQEEGDNLEIPRDVEHYVSFATPTQKERFLKKLDLDGFSFKDEISSEEFTQNCVAFENGIALVKNHAVTSEEVHKNVHLLYEKVTQERGSYEGWSTTLVEQEEE